MAHDIKTNMSREVIRFCGEMNGGQKMECEASIADGIIVYKFKNHQLMLQAFIKERDARKNPVMLHERICAFSEIREGKTKDELKAELIGKLKDRGISDITEKIAGRVIKKIEEKKK